jgi:hypothetical protein
VGLGLLRVFITVNISGVGSLAPRITPNLEEQRLHFVLFLPFDLSGMGSSTKSLRTRPHSSPADWSAQKAPLHDKAVALEVEYRDYLGETWRRSYHPPRILPEDVED